MKIAIRKVLLTSPRASQNPMRVFFHKLVATLRLTCCRLRRDSVVSQARKQADGLNQLFAAGQQALELPPRSLQWREVVHRGKTFSDLWGLSPWEDLLLRQFLDPSGLPLGEGFLLGDLLLCF